MFVACVLLGWKPRKHRLSSGAAASPVPRAVSRVSDVREFGRHPLRFVGGGSVT